VLLEDGPEGPKHVGAAKKKHLNTNCSILYFNKQCIRWTNNFILIKMHGRTTIKMMYVCIYWFQNFFLPSIIFIHQLMHLYIYYQIIKTLCSFDSSYMFRHTACHHQGTPLSWLKSLVKNIRS
jgi:hypothetical protein